MQNEWVKWEGGECPVPAGTLVDVRCRNGYVHHGFDGENLRWNYSGFGGSIIAYRIAQKSEQPDSEGWIKWDGGECPVPVGTLVDIRYGDGDECPGIDAKTLRWNHLGLGGDIIAYRIVQKPEQSKDEDLLDRFAIAALQGIMADPKFELGFPPDGKTVGDYAYAVAKLCVEAKRKLREGGAK